MKEELIAFTDPKSPVAEMFKTLRTNIQFMNSNKPLKTLLVTSTLPGEGKSWTSSNLAITFAQAGKRVLLIDADLRKGRLFNVFDVPPTPGLSNYLSGIIAGESGDYELERFIKETEIENFDLLPAGDVPPNPTELLVSEKMLDLVRRVKEEYDITIFDGTPGLLVADASIISRIVDSTIIVTAHNETKIDNVAEVKKSIEKVGGKVAGVVLNKIPTTTKKYEDSYYYGHSTSTALVEDKKDRKKLNQYEKNKSRHEEQVKKKEEKVIEEDNAQKEQAEEQLPKAIRNVKANYKEEVTANDDLLKQINSYKEKTPQNNSERPRKKRRNPQEIDRDRAEEASKENKIKNEEDSNNQPQESAKNNKPVQKKEINKDIIFNEDKERKQNITKTKLENNIDNEEEPQFEETAGPKLSWENDKEEKKDSKKNSSWEEEAETAYKKIKNQKKRENDQKKKKVSDVELSKTEDILNQINEYIAQERKKFKNGGLDD